MSQTLSPSTVQSLPAMTTEQDSKPQIPTEIIVTKTRARYTKSKLEDLPPVDLPGLSKGHCVTVFVRTAHRTPQQQDVHLTCGPLPLRALCTFSPYIDAAVTKFRIRHLIVDQHTLQRVKAIYIVSDAFDGIDGVARYISKCITSQTTQLLPWGVEAHTPLSSLSAAADAAVYLGMHSMAAMLRSHFAAARYQPDRNRRRRKNDHALTPDKRWNPLLPDLLALTAQYPRDTAVRRTVATDIWSSIHNDAMHIDARTAIEEYINRNGWSGIGVRLLLGARHV